MIALMLVLFVVSIMIGCIVMFYVGGIIESIENNDDFSYILTAV